MIEVAHVTKRIMVGLTLPTGGHVTIGGHRYADLVNPGRHVGVLLDASAQHTGRTGRPSRGRILAAKVVAAVLFGLAAIVVAILFRALGTLLFWIDPNSARSRLFAGVAPSAEVK